MTRGWSRGVLRGTAAAAGRVVVKIGGSLLTRPHWRRVVGSLLDDLPAPRVIVVGGGPLVDGLRVIDAAEPLPADLVHRLAVACMGHTAGIVAEALDLPLVAEPDATAGPTAVLDAPEWLARRGRLDRLPVGWHVTSDSIAAFVAAECGGGLLLVKSVAPPLDQVGQLGESGWVDAFFPTAARHITWIGWAAPA